MRPGRILMPGRLLAASSVSRRVHTAYKKCLCASKERITFLPLAPSAVMPRCAALRAMSGPSSPVSSLRTGTTSALWQRRRELEAYKDGASKPQTVFLDKSPRDSMIRIELPIATDPVLRSQYLNFRNGVRFGKLLEDIDAFAGNIAFLHCDDSSPETMQHRLVTACLDRLDLIQPVTLSLEDLTLQGQAAWAGRSSLQIDVNLFRQNGEMLLGASIVFVSVGPDGKGCRINALIPTTDQEKEMFRRGEEANEQRKVSRQTSLKTTPPIEAEIKHLHSVMMQRVPDDSQMSLQSTQLQNVSLMQPQERNRAGKIFGGFLMREAYELAYTCASAFCAASGKDSANHGAPTIVAVDDVSFTKPVGIGDVVTLTSRVVYAGANERSAPSDQESGPLAALFQVRVEIEIMNLATGARQLSNEFHWTFLNRDTTIKNSVVPLPVKPIIPSTYSEGMLWLDGRRRMLEAIKFGQQWGSCLLKDI